LTFHQLALHGLADWPFDVGSYFEEGRIFEKHIQKRTQIDDCDSSHSVCYG